MKCWLRAWTCLLCSVLLLGCAPDPATTDRPAGVLELQGVLGGGAEGGYLRAEGQRAFRFPEDHGLHGGYRNEWWYFTGNLAAADGRRFGFQLTFFTHALPPATAAPEAGSAWRSERLWMAHFAVVDHAGRVHQAFERFSREALGLAGAQVEPAFRVWLDDWQVAQPGPVTAQPQEGSPWLLHAAAGELVLDLALQTGKAPVLQGENGLSRKSAAPGNASWYYSLTRLVADGHLQLGDARVDVSGSAWLDREWSTSALDADQSGWDWFSLQFDDGSELMYYQLRDGAGQAHAFSSGSAVGQEGERSVLDRDAVELVELAHWTAPNGVRYTTRWRLSVAGRELVVEALLDDQWMSLSLPYWEGAVTAFDANSGVRLGHGYLEMVR